MMRHLSLSSRLLLSHLLVVAIASAAAFGTARWLGPQLFDHEIQQNRGVPIFPGACVNSDDLHTFTPFLVKEVRKFRLLVMTHMYIIEFFLMT